MKQFFLFLMLFSSTSVLAQNTSDTLQTTMADTVEIIEPLMVDMPSYSMELPNTWEIKAGCIETQCTALSPRDTLLGFDTYIESVNLTVNKLSSASYTAEKYANFSIGYLPKVVKEFRVMERKKLNSRSYRITYTGVKNNIRQTWRQYYHVKNSKVYIVTFSAQQKKYRFYDELMEPYLASFKFK